MRSPALLPLRLALLGVLPWALPLHAQAEGGPSFDFRGFATLALTHNATDKAEFIRDVAQPKGPRHATVGAVDSRLGLQGNLHLAEQWELVAQVVSARRYDDTFKPDLTWAFLKYRANDTVEARAGRLGFDVYLLADTRNVGYSNLWVRPPTEFFGGIPITSFDGGDLVAHGSVAGGYGSLKLFGGQAVGRIPSGPTTVFDLKGSPLMGAHLDLRRGDWGARVAWTQLRFKKEFNADVDGLLSGLRDPALAPFSPEAAPLADQLALTDKWIRYLSLGVDFQRGAFSSQLSLSRTTTQSLSLPDGRAGYLLAAYRMGDWTPFVTYATVKTTPVHAATGLPDLPPFSGLNAGVLYLTHANQSDQHTLSLGLRWDFHRNLCLKAQVDAVEATPGATQLWWRVQPGWSGRTTVATLALDAVF